ncbi:MAG: response regulator transcription factor [Elusimicrobiota bacterium]
MSQLLFWVVSSDTAVSRRWETLLTREGWPVTVEPDLQRFAAEAVKSRYGVALLDWDLSRAATAANIRKIKARAAGVSFILISDATLVPDKVIEVLEAGADDHFLKNIHDNLLLAKLKAHMRRILPSLASALDVVVSPGGEIKIDRSKHEALVKGTRGRMVGIPGLTRTEFSILALFLEQTGKVLERQFIMEAVWKDQGDDIRPGTVDKHIESLRRKLGRYGKMVQTIYGVGYAFREKG